MSEEPDELDDYVPEGDADLAATMRSMGAVRYLEPEEIVASDWLMTATNRDRLNIGRGERFANLSCGHEVVTRNQRHMICPKCRYLLLNGYDYDGFRRLGLPDPLAGYWHKVKL